MTIDPLAYTKTLETSGLERKTTEAHAEALTKHVLPDLAAKADLAAAKVDIERAIERVEHRLRPRLIRIVCAFDAALFALLRFVH